MNTLKRFLALAMVAAATVATVNTSFAQPGGGGGQQGGQGGPQQREQLTAKQRTEMLDKEVTLTKEQSSEIKAIYQKYADASEKERAEMRNSGQRPNRELMQAKMKESNDKMNLEIKGKLTEAQAVKFDTYLEKQAEKQAAEQANREQRQR
ncbi:MAG: hypothetical protein SNH79_00595 [Rikenellaceae bacterium]